MISPKKMKRYVSQSFLIARTKMSREEFLVPSANDNLDDIAKQFKFEHNLQIVLEQTGEYCIDSAMANIACQNTNLSNDDFNSIKNYLEVYINEYI